ncbi:MAG: TIGR04086 family membrane protein [Clostridia bacterium]|nr:TIGR04086 family membrane protein [Clostridia bacterium]
MKKNETVSQAKSPVKTYIAAVAASFVLCWIFLVLGALLITYAGVPKDAAWIITLVSVGLSSFAGAFACAAGFGSRGMIHGIITGAILFAVIYIVGTVCFDAEAVFKNALVRLVVMLALGAAGGVAGVNLKLPGRK